jgi:hypothetical protein
MVTRSPRPPSLRLPEASRFIALEMLTRLASDWSNRLSRLSVSTFAGRDKP